MDDKTKKLVDAYGLSLAGRYVASVEIDTVSNARAALNAHLSALLAERAGLATRVVKAEADIALACKGHRDTKAVLEALRAENERIKVRFEAASLLADMVCEGKCCDGEDAKLTADADKAVYAYVATLPLARAALNPADKEPSK